MKVYPCNNTKICNENEINKVLYTFLIQVTRLIDNFAC